MVQLLIKCGIQVDNCNKVGNPPIVYAIVYNHHDIVEILTQHKAKVEGIIVQENLRILDLTVLHGRYLSAQHVFSMGPLRETHSYSATDWMIILSKRIYK